MNKQFTLKHTSTPNWIYGFPCQTTFFVKGDEVTVRTIMNDMGSDGMWEETFNKTMPIEEARGKWRELIKNNGRWQTP